MILKKNNYFFIEVYWSYLVYEKKRIESIYIDRFVYYPLIIK